MERSKVRKLQEAQLDILKYVDAICNELGINYYLAFGTLLGAIRNNGTIPWDADIDIVLLREDYEILGNYLIKQKDSKYVYVDYTQDPNHISPHALLINKDTHIIGNENSKTLLPRKYDGVYIDIFPLDKTSDDRAKQIRQAKKISKILKIISLKNPVIHYGNNWNYKQIAKIIISLCLKPITFRQLGLALNKEMQKYENCDSNSYVIPTDETCFDRIVPFDYYFPPRRVKYEDTNLSIPARSEDILQLRYGDYLSLPPENERWEYLDTHITKVIYEDGTE